MVCISLEYNNIINVAVYEVRLNLSGSVIEFEDTALAEKLATNISISNSNSSSNFSNFIIADHRIIFATGNTVIVIVLDILDPVQTQQYSAAESSECTQIYKIVPTTGIGGQQLLVAYCMHGYICFDPLYGDWTEEKLFSSNGVPYLCPDSNYEAILFKNSSSSLRLSEGESLFTINNVSISSGVCFESQNITYFAYSDQQHNYIYVYDFIKKSHYPVSPYICSHVHWDCPRLFILGNQYLIIHDSNHDLVLDTKTNFSLIINITSGIADILVVLHSNIHSAITPSPPVILSTTTANVPPAPGMNIATSTLISTPYYYTHVPTPSSSDTVYSTITVTTASPGTKCHNPS